MRAILTFHSIETSGSVISYDPRRFEALLGLICKQAIPICDLDSLLAGKQKDGVAITFDDGMKSVYQNALPILRKYQAPAHVFLSTKAIGAGSYWPGQSANVPSLEMLDWGEVERLHAAGIHVENHTHSHPDLRLLDADQLADECSKADEIITSRLGRKPKYFAYPYGFHTQTASDYLRPRYSGCLTTELRKLGNDEDSALLPRLDAYYLRSQVHIRLFDSTLMHFYLKFRNGMRKLKGRARRATNQGNP